MDTLLPVLVAELAAQLLKLAGCVPLLATQDARLS